MTQKKKTTKSAIGKRRSHHALKAKDVRVCPKCKHAVLPHQTCTFCGTYKGRQVIKK